MHGPTDMPGGGTIWGQTALLWVAFAVTAIGAGGLAIRWLRGPRAPVDRRRAAGAAALLLLALGLRLLVAPHTVVTENAHGYEYLRGAFQLDGYPYHGQAYYAFFYLVTSLLGRHPEVVFTANAFLGAMGALLLVPLGHRLTGQRAAGWVAGLGYACWPAVLRISASEAMFPFGICCALLAWLAWLKAWETGEPLRFLLAAALATVTVQTRPELAPWPIVLVLSLPLSRGWTRTLRRPGPWVGLAAFVLLSWAWALFRLEVHRAAGVPDFMNLAPGATLAAFASRNNLLLRPEWTPAVVWALVPLGLVSLAVGRRRAVPALLLGPLVIGWMVMTVHVAEVTNVRLQSPVHPLVLLTLGAGVAGVAERLEGRARAAAFVLLAGALAVTSALRFPKVRESFDPQREYAFLARTVPALPEGCAVITAPRSMARNLIITEFPVWWLRGPVEQADRYLRAPQILEGHSCRLFYRGLTCYQFAHDEAVPPGPDALRPECREVERRFRLAPIAHTSFPSRPYQGIRVPAPTITLGFYRLEPTAAAPATQP
jgi:hypothetical protein